jgi:hypothetical protein
LWHNPAAGDKQPHEQKDKHRKDTAASWAQGNLMQSEESCQGWEEQERRKRMGKRRKKKKKVM